MPYVKLAKVSEIPEDSGLRVEYEDEAIALFKHDGKVFAIADTCSHAEASLSRGEKIGDRVKCPEHGAEFSIVTGKALTFPAVAPVERYDVRIEDDYVYVDVE